jgi:hypothetical protein
MTGAVYLLYFLTAVPGEVLIRQAGVSGIQAGVSGDAAATAAAVLAHESLFRLGFALGLVSIACYTALTGLLYRLLRPVSGSVALVAAFLSLVGMAVQASGSLLQLAPLVILGGSPYLGAFDASQLRALALLCLHLTRRSAPSAWCSTASSSSWPAASSSCRPSCPGPLAWGWRWPDWAG